MAKAKSLHARINKLSPARVARAVVALGAALQSKQESEFDETKAKQVLESAQVDGHAKELKEKILSESTEKEDWDRWGRGFLHFAADDSDLQQVTE